MRLRRNCSFCSVCDRRVSGAIVPSAFTASASYTPPDRSRPSVIPLIISTAMDATMTAAMTRNRPLRVLNIGRAHQLLKRANAGGARVGNEHGKLVAGREVVN